MSFSKRKGWRPKRDRRRGHPPDKGDDLYKFIYRQVDAAVMDAFNNHPEYIAEGVNEPVVRMSITKRVAGLIWSFAKRKG